MLRDLISTAVAQGLTILPGEESTLAGRIRTGQITLGDIPTFITYFIQTTITLAGMVSFLMILVGGYQYIVGGVYSEMRDQGKSTLTYAIIGFVLTLLAYAIVSVVQLFATAL